MNSIEFEKGSCTEGGGTSLNGGSCGSSSSDKSGGGGGDIIGDSGGSDIAGDNELDLLILMNTMNVRVSITSIYYYYPTPLLEPHCSRLQP